MPSALIIEDNQQMAESLAQMVEIFGLDVDIAYGARTGMIKLQQEVPDVVFLDVNMPGVDGFEVMAYFRRLPQMKDVPVIVVTSDDQPETLKKARDTGVLAFMVKPADVNHIEAALRAAGVLPE
jgi:chemosensory pili system protein ChpA (sensor histidine kinase/response regulator)